MVNTMNNKLVLNTPPPTYLIQAALAAIQETLANIQAEVRTHSTKIASLKRGEGTSQPRTDELTVQPRPHLEPNNTPYGKLIRFEFLKFSGDDVKDWVYRCKQFFKVDRVPDRRKIQLASMHMFDAALVWYQQYVKKYLNNTPWEYFKSFQNKVFTSDVMLLPLGGCEMVLGIQWLATLGDMQCNFKKLIMKFNHKGKQPVLRGMNNTHMKSVGSVSTEVEQVLTQFDEVFKVPKDFPP
nr:reverse transcriptase [Tanacetum cinerariifolium]